MNLNNWHSFINIVAEAGYISDKLIASSNAIVFSYVLYLIAKYDYKLDAAQLKKCTSKWFFMSTITYFYTGSTESKWKSNLQICVMFIRRQSSLPILTV